MASLAAQTRDYIRNHPAVSDALRLGIANHSALARQIAAELGTPRVDAVLAACRRRPLEPGRGHREEVIRRVLRRSRIETRTKIATVTVTQGTDVLQRLGDLVEELLDENAICRLIQVSRGTVIIVGEDSVPRFVRALRESQILGIRRNLVELAVTGPESIEKTPGLLALLASILSARGINIIEAISCYTDTIFILEADDLTVAVEALAHAVA